MNIVEKARKLFQPRTEWLYMDTQKQITATLNIEIEGCHITVNADTEPELLKKTCRVLRSLS